MDKVKKITFFFLMMVMVIVIIELIGNIAFIYLYGYRYTPKNLLSHVNSLYGLPSDLYDNLEDDNPSFIKMEDIHPYLGYVPFWYPKAVNRFLRSMRNGSLDDDLVIVVVGGSVAGGLVPYITDEFEVHIKGKGIKKSPFVVPLAAGGYKQPQQLIAITYFLSLGAKIDYVINIDGFNEVVLPYQDNYLSGVFPFYPRLWGSRINKKPDLDTLSLIGRVVFLRNSQSRMINNLNSNPLRISGVYGLYIAYKLNKIEKEIINANAQITKDIRNRKNSFEVTGPYFKYNNVDDLYKRSAEVWLNSSIILHRLSKTFGFKYYHFLQPNQYVPDSKHLSIIEKQHFYDENHPYRKGVLSGYPYLIEKGKKLKEEGVNFYDLTTIFKDNKETLYNDTCCHFNKKGYALLAKYIVDKIIEDSKSLK